MEAQVRLRIVVLASLVAALAVCMVMGLQHWEVQVASKQLDSLTCSSETVSDFALLGEVSVWSNAHPKENEEAYNGYVKALNTGKVISRVERAVPPQAAVCIFNTNGTPMQGLIGVQYLLSYRPMHVAIPVECKEDDAWKMVLEKQIELSDFLAFTLQESCECRVFVRSLDEREGRAGFRVVAY